MENLSWTGAWIHPWGAETVGQKKRKGTSLWSSNSRIVAGLTLIMLNASSLEFRAAGGLELDAVLVSSNLPQPTHQARCSQWLLLAQELIFLELRGPGQEQE